jgi:hypothetical protein
MYEAKVQEMKAKQTSTIKEKKEKVKSKSNGKKEIIFFAI